MRPNVPLRTVLVAGTILGWAAGAAHGAGAVSLYNVPVRVSEDAIGSGNKKVSFGWSEGPLAGGNPLWYALVATPLTVGGSQQSATVFYDGNVFKRYSASLTLVDAVKYRIQVTTYAMNGNLPMPVGLSNTFDTTTDFSRDVTYPTVTLNGGQRYTNRLTVNVRVSGYANDLRTNQAQLLFGSSSLWPQPSAFPCTNVENTCPLKLAKYSSATNSYYADDQRELPAGDGPKYLWTIGRDDAGHPTLNPGGFFGTPLLGNPSIFPNFGSITLDTTAPVAKLASANVDGVAGSPVTLDATPSSDATSGVDQGRFTWTWGDGSAPQTGAGKLTHVYPGPGTYNGKVVVRDLAGTAADALDTNVSSTTFKVTIAPAPVATPTPAPTAAATQTPAPTPTPGAVDLATPPTPTPQTPFAEPAAAPDIPLTELDAAGDDDPTTAAAGKTAKGAAKGALSTARITTTTPRAGKAFSVKVGMRRKASVSFRIVDATEKSLTKRTSTLKNGSQTVSLTAPVKAGKYVLLVSNASTTLALQFTAAAPKTTTSKKKK